MAASKKHSMDDTFEPRSPADWRTWLQQNGEDSPGIWVVLRKKSSQNTTSGSAAKTSTNDPGCSYPFALDEALCFGWIDGTKRARPDDGVGTFLQYWTKRDPLKSAWSAVNKAHVDRLAKIPGKMDVAGLAVVAAAKKSGMWTRMDAVERLEVPAELRSALLEGGVEAGWEDEGLLSRSKRKFLLARLEHAKGEDTRKKRVQEAVEAVREKMGAGGGKKAGASSSSAVRKSDMKGAKKNK